MTKPRWVLVLVLALVGMIWIGQGTGLLPGSFMTNDPFWTAAGVILLAAAGWLVWKGRGEPS